MPLHTLLLFAVSTAIRRSIVSIASYSGPSPRLFRSTPPLLSGEIAAPVCEFFLALLQMMGETDRSHREGTKCAGLGTGGVRWCEQKRCDRMVSYVIEGPR